MNKKGKVRGTFGALVIRYKGQLMTCNEIAATVDDYDINGKTIYERLRRAGFPPKIDKGNSAALLGPLKHPVTPDYCFSVEGDDRKYTGAELSRMFVIPRYVMSRLKAKGRTSFSKVELESIAKNILEDKKQPTVTDLKNLSGKRNTGAGRSDSTEPVTIASVKKLASAVIRSAFTHYLRPPLTEKMCKDKSIVTTAAREKELSASFLFTENEMRKFWFENLGIREDTFCQDYIDKNGPEILRRLACETYEGRQIKG